MPQGQRNADPATIIDLRPTVTYPGIVSFSLSFSLETQDSKGEKKKKKKKKLL